MPLKKKAQYATVHLPIELLKIVDCIIEDGKYGYSSRAEFVKDATRRYLEWTAIILLKNQTLILKN